MGTPNEAEHTQQCDIGGNYAEQSHNTNNEEKNYRSGLHDGEHVGKRKNLWSRGKKYSKILCLVVCWLFYTSVLILYGEKKVVEKHTSLAEGKIKTFEVTTTSNPFSLWVGLNGPFWSQQLQTKYKNNVTDDTRFLQVWIESVEVEPHNGTGRDTHIKKSLPWMVRLLNNDLVDLSEGEPRSTVLKLQDLEAISEKNEYLHKYFIKFMHNTNVTVPFTTTYSANPLDTKVGIIYAAILLIGLYVVIIFDIINRTLAAILSSMVSIAVLALVGERPSMMEILRWMDAETLLLLFSMMLLVTLMMDAGVFDYLAVVAFERTRGQTWPLINVVYLLTIVVSLFLDNVTTVLLLTPAIIRLCEVTNLNPVPILMGMVIFCNVGGTATPVGDPPNIIIATNPVVLQAGINFTNFTVHMFVGVVLVFIQTYIQFRFMYRDINKLRLKETNEIRELREKISAWKLAGTNLKDYNKEERTVKKVVEKKLQILEQKIAEEAKKQSPAMPRQNFEKTLKELKEKYFIRDKTLLVQSMISITFIILLFFLHSLPQFQCISLGWSALLGVSLLLVLSDQQELQPALARLEWATLLFFAALFVFMEAITKLGLIQWIGSLTEGLILVVHEDYRLMVAILLVLWVSGITSAFVDNIPLTSMMVRVVTSLGSNSNLGLPMAPLIWALSFGACMGGNGTLVGASANVITAGLAEQHNYKFTFKEFFKIGAPMTIGHLLVCSVYLIIAHCVFEWH